MFLKEESRGKEKGTHYISTCARERGKREEKGDRKGKGGKKGTKWPKGKDKEEKREKFGGRKNTNSEKKDEGAKSYIKDCPFIKKVFFILKDKATTCMQHSPLVHRYSSYQLQKDDQIVFPHHAKGCSAHCNDDISRPLKMLLQLTIPNW